MDIPTRRARSLQQAAGVALGVMITVLLGGGTASAAEAAPQLSIAVDDGHTSTAPGDTLVYTITVRNLGTAAVTGLKVTQSVPAGLAFETADPVGRSDAGSVGWGVDLKAAAEATFTSRMTVSTTPAELLRLATVACARMSADGPPIVCASHSDQLPAGASAAAVRAADASSARLVPWYIGGAAVVLIAVVVAAVVYRRRTRH